jgi:hypothetical protein
MYHCFFHCNTAEALTLNSVVTRVVALLTSMIAKFNTAKQEDETVDHNKNTMTNNNFD